MVYYTIPFRSFSVYTFFDHETEVWTMLLQLENSFQSEGTMHVLKGALHQWSEKSGTDAVNGEYV
jgi:hypothetical protein